MEKITQTLGPLPTPEISQDVDGMPVSLPHPFNQVPKSSLHLLLTSLTEEPTPLQTSTASDGIKEFSHGEISNKDFLQQLDIPIAVGSAHVESFEHNGTTIQHTEESQENVTMIPLLRESLAKDVTSAINESEETSSTAHVTLQSFLAAISQSRVEDSKVNPSDSVTDGPVLLPFKTTLRTTTVSTTTTATTTTPETTTADNSPVGVLIRLISDAAAPLAGLSAATLAYSAAAMLPVWLPVALGGRGKRSILLNFSSEKRQQQGDKPSKLLRLHNLLNLGDSMKNLMVQSRSYLSHYGHLQGALRKRSKKFTTLTKISND